MPELLETLQQVSGLLASLARVDRSTLTDLDLVALLAAEESVGRLADASRILTAGEVAERSRYELGGDGLSMRYNHRKPVDFIERVTRASKAEAARRIRIGTAIRDRQTLTGDTLPPLRPIVAEAVRAGDHGVDAASNIIGYLKQAATGSEATPENMDAAEAALVGLASTDGADDVAAIARAWRDAMDPDGIEPRYEDIRARQGVFITPERKGITTYTIKAAPVLASQLDAVFLDSMGKNAVPRFMSDEEIAASTELVEDEAGTVTERLTDRRTLPQKRGDILEGVLIEAIRATQDAPANLRTIGSVTAVITMAELESGKGFGIIEGTDETVPASVIQELVCDAGFYPVLISGDGIPLKHGLLERYFTQAQRRAIVVRDGDRCIAKGCRKRAAGSHAHHVVFWSEGGRTDIDNGVMLCPEHHHALHQGAFEIRMIDGHPWIRDGIDYFSEDAWQPAGKNRLLKAAA